MESEKSEMTPSQTILDHVETCARLLRGAELKAQMILERVKKCEELLAEAENLAALTDEQQREAWREMCRNSKKNFRDSLGKMLAELEDVAKSVESM